MKKLESTFWNMVLVLFGVAFISSLLLGIVHKITKAEIERAQMVKQFKSVIDVLNEGFDNNPGKEVVMLLNDENQELECFPAKKGDKLDSVAVKATTPQGFSGNVTLMVGFLADGSINKISVLEQKETPGLGTKMTEEKFKSQFYGKNLENFKAMVKKDGGDVDAITAATISSRAFCDAVNRAYKVFKTYKSTIEF